MNAAKSGCGSHGRERNSGWNCPATNHGWSGSSMISTSCFSGQMPEMRKPVLLEPASGSRCSPRSGGGGAPGWPPGRRPCDASAALAERRPGRGRAAWCRPCRRSSRCSGRRSITGCGVAGSNSVELAPASPQTCRANSITAHCMPEADAEERHALARARSGSPRSSPRCRGRRSRPAPGCRPRPRGEPSAPSRSMLLGVHPPHVHRAPRWRCRRGPAPRTRLL